MNHDFPDPAAHDNISHNPSFAEMRSYSEHMEQTTAFGAPIYRTEFSSRNYEKTKNAVEDQFSPEDEDAMEEALAFLRENEVVCVDRMLGRKEGYAYCCRYFVPKEHARLALAWATLLEPADGREPDFVTVQLPDRDEVRVRTFPEERVTYVLGTDYTGEAKMSFLRLWLYEAKKTGGLGLHAGSKRVVLERDGDLETAGQLYLGLSATGKSTLTGHGFGLEDPEKAELLQDDICALLPEGGAAGSEGGGLYLKTYGLTEEEQPELYHAVTQPHAVLENVAVDDDGTVDFFDDSITRNARAAVRREDLASAAPDIDLAAVDQIVFITRNPIMPPIARLTPEQGAAAFMLGESVETSAGDPDRAGEQIHVVGTNPFIIGPPGEEGNRFLDLVRANHIQCFVINTGQEGPETPIRVKDSATILREVARGSIEWERDELLGLDLPMDVPRMAIEELYPPDHIDDYEERLEEARADREEWLARFDALRDEIRDAVY